MYRQFVHRKRNGQVYGSLNKGSSNSSIQARLAQLKTADWAPSVPGQVSELPLTAADPDGGPLSLALERAPSFVTLIDYGDGTGVLRLAPTGQDGQRCDFRIRVVATDTGSPPLADAVTLDATFRRMELYLPVVGKKP